jgi:hypothetical protein
MRTWKYPVVRLSDCKLWFPFQKEKNSNDANSRSCGPASPEVVEDRE